MGRLLGVALFGIMVSISIPQVTVSIPRGAHASEPARAEATPRPSGFEELPDHIEVWVEQLSHDQYAIRSRAARTMVHWNTPDTSFDQKLHRLARDPSRSVEFQFAIRSILGKRQVRRVDRALQRLQSTDGDFSNEMHRATAEAIPGWDVWQGLLGRGFASRIDFVRAYQHSPSLTSQLSDVARTDSTHLNLAAFVAVLEKASYRSRVEEDPTFWSMMLAIRLTIPDSGDTKASRLQIDKHLTRYLSREPRLAEIRSPSSASRQASNPSPQQPPGFHSMSRLVQRWLSRTSVAMSRRTAILTALRCGCPDLAESMSRKVVRRRSDSSPADLVTAMLVLARPCGEFSSEEEPSEMDLRLPFDDDRVAFQWQVLAEQRTVINIQVRDVAVAIALDRRGVNIRRYGFQFAQADPLLGFRDDRLGFATEEQRQRTLRRALELLKVGNSRSPDR